LSGQRATDFPVGDNTCTSEQYLALFIKRVQHLHKSYQAMALSALVHCAYSHTFSTRAAVSYLSDRGLERGQSPSVPIHELCHTVSYDSDGGFWWSTL